MIQLFVIIRYRRKLGTNENVKSERLLYLQDYGKLSLMCIW